MSSRFRRFGLFAALVFLAACSKPAPEPTSAPDPSAALSAPPVSAAPPAEIAPVTSPEVPQEKVAPPVVSSAQPKAAIKQTGKIARGRPIVDPAELQTDIVQVPRAAFSSAIDRIKREPTDRYVQLPAQARKLFFWTEIRDQTGKEIVHEWWYQGRKRATIPFQVAGPRWRVWSSKNLMSSWKGDWTVKVVRSEDGQVLLERSIQFGNPDQ